MQTKAALLRMKRAREVAAHHLAHPMTYGETLAHGAYFGALFFEMHHVYVMMGGVMLLVILVRIIVGVFE